MPCRCPAKHHVSRDTQIRTMSMPTATQAIDRTPPTSMHLTPAFEHLRVDDGIHQRLHRPQISMNFVDLTLPSPALAPLIAGLMVVDMQPEHISATTRRSTLIRIPPKEKLSAVTFNGR